MNPDGTGKLLEHERGWRKWFLAYSVPSNDPADKDADLWRGVGAWVKDIFPRSYALDDAGMPYDDTYHCPMVWNASNPAYWLPNLLVGLANVLMHVRVGFTLIWLRAHEGAHTNTFGAQFPCHPGPGVAVPCGKGLDHEPVPTLDVMLPGWASFLRCRDTRGIIGAYKYWVDTGRVVRVREV